MLSQTFRHRFRLATPRCGSMEDNLRSGDGRALIVSDRALKDTALELRHQGGGQYRTEERCHGKVLSAEARSHITYTSIANYLMSRSKSAHIAVSRPDLSPALLVGEPEIFGDD